MTTKDSKIEKALSAEQKGSQLQELEQEETYLTSKMLEWLMPWLEKTDEESTLGFWQDTLPTTMMVKLLEVWLTEKSRLRSCSCIILWIVLQWPMRWFST